MSIIPSDDARTALSGRLERFVKGRWVPEDGQPREMIDEVIAALRTPALDLRAWVQHKSTCPKWRDPVDGAYCCGAPSASGIYRCWLVRDHDGLHANGSYQWLDLLCNPTTCGLDAALSSHNHLASQPNDATFPWTTTRNLDIAIDK